MAFTSLVSGGAGFIGSHLCDALLDQDHRVLCLDNFVTGARQNIAHLRGNRHFQLIEHDVTTPLTLSGLDRIYHLASPASPKDFPRMPIEILWANAAGTRNMLELARKNRARFLYTSSSEVYGDPEEHPQRETYWGHVNPTGPRSCYDEGKRFSEALIVAYHRRHRVDVRIARIFNTYGPRMRKDDGRVIPTFVGQALAGQSITVYGIGKQTRSFCAITDMIRGLLSFMEKKALPQRVVNLGNPHEVRIRDLAKLVCRLTGSKSRIVFRPLPEDDPHARRPDISRAKTILRWMPRIPFEKGLKNTIAWFRLSS